MARDNKSKEQKPPSDLGSAREETQPYATEIEDREMEKHQKENKRNDPNNSGREPQRREP